MTRRAKTALDCCVIELTRGHVAIVDARDYEWLAQWRWWLDRRSDRHLYAVRQERLRGRRFQIAMHQLIIGDVPAGMKIYHVNQWGLDNRRCNLIVGPEDLGHSLLAPPERTKTSRFKGVHLSYRTVGGEDRWQANISVAGRVIYLGVYDDEVEAAEAHDLEAIRYYGPQVYLNFPERIQEYLRLVRSLARPHREDGDNETNSQDLGDKVMDEE